ncbi:MAG: porphobilinogen synthase, partial [Candidatus Omnitrophica bacterium]|nr:porphobilinogen synthase [Candidatus Omnitrophota bacterium]
RLSQIALSHARAGADWVAPSAMAKGQVHAIRAALDKNGYSRTKILGYSAKFASSFYGPFRNACASAPRFANRSSYQLDYQGSRKALQEIADDIKEGADTVMVKPALAYLDVIREAKEKFAFPLAAYNVSAEYVLVKLGAREGLFSERKMVSEIISSIKRAGADYIITYHAKDIAKWLKEN